MSLPVCRIRMGSAAPQLAQAAAGFTQLEQRGLLRLRYEGIAGLQQEGLYSHNILLEAQLDDTVIAYDLADSYEDILQKEVFDRQLDRVSFYYKRSYDRLFHNEMKNRHKLRPLGLHYDVTCPGNFMSTGRSGNTPESYMSHNSYPDYKAQLLTRLLDPEGIQGEAFEKRHPHLTAAEAQALAEETIAEYERINAHRIACIRACREAFGPRFFGGLAPTPYAEQTAPDLVLDAPYTNKRDVLRSLKENYVCVVPEGPHQRIGRRMAECCAAGRAIVTAPLRFVQPGGFSRGRNYLTYRTPEECAEQVGLLLRNTPHIHRMEAANFAYYNGFVRPDAMILRTLEEACPQLFAESIA